MKQFILTYFILLISLTLHSQLVFRQDVVQGGITGGGFSTCLGSGSGDVELYIEPGSTIKEAWLFCYRTGYETPNATIVFNGSNYLFSPENQLSPLVDNFGSWAPAYAVHGIDITSDVSASQNIYNVDIPPQPVQPCANCVYGAVYVVIVYENLSLPNTAYSILLNDKDNTATTSYSVNQLNEIDVSQPVGFAVHTDRINDGNDQSILRINGTNIGQIGGNDAVDAPWGCGVKGHFYYQNNTLFGLDDDVPNNTVDASDGLADISSYLSSNSSFDFSLQYVNPTSPNLNTNRYLSYYVSYTTPCTELPTTLTKDTTICYGAAVALEATGGTGYEWFPQKNLSCYNCANPTFTGDSTTLYTVRIRNGANCSKVLPVRVEVLPELKTQSVSTTTSICGEDGAEVSISAVGGRSPYSYTLGTATNSTGNFSNVYAGNHTINIEDAWGCTTTQNITIDSVNLATANFTATPTFGKVPLKVRLTNESANTTNYQWYVNGELQATTRNWETVLNPSGSYELMLVTYNKQPQCADTLWRTIHAFDSAQIIIPNVFTPNDDGLNDQFSVTTFGVKKIHYQIYNRYQTLFTEGELSTSLEEVKSVLWLGTNPDTTTPAKPDVYFYIITTYDWADRKKHHTGYVHLKR